MWVTLSVELTSGDGGTQNMYDVGDLLSMCQYEYKYDCICQSVLITGDTVVHNMCVSTCHYECDCSSVYVSGAYYW